MPDAWISHEADLAALPRIYRPREKLFARGAGALGKAELVALVLGSGHAKIFRGDDGRATAPAARVEGTEGADPAGVGEGAGGRGRARSAPRRRVRAGAPRARPARPTSVPRSRGPQDAWTVTRELARAKKEHLVGLYLDAHNGLIHKETISIGSLNTTRTHPREILYPAIVHLALGFILVHNHPSGSLDPSDEDVAFTRGVHRAGEIVGIELYDHLIVARKRLRELEGAGRVLEIRPVRVRLRAEGGCWSMRKLGFALEQLAILVALASFVIAEDAPKTTWKITGQLEEACSCSAACPCWFGSKPTKMTCGGGQFVFITKGTYGGTKLDGLAVGAMSQSPEGKGMMESFGDWNFNYYYIDEKATPEQRKALEAIAHDGLGRRRVEEERDPLRPDRPQDRREGALDLDRAVREVLGSRDRRGSGRLGEDREPSRRRPAPSRVPAG